MKFDILTEDENVLATIEDEVIISGIRMKCYYSPHPAAELVRGHQKIHIFYQKNTLLKVGHYIGWMSWIYIINTTLLFEKLSLLFKRFTTYASQSQLNGFIEMTNHEISFTLFDVFTIVLYKVEAKTKNDPDSLVQLLSETQSCFLTFKYSSQNSLGQTWLPTKPLHSPELVTFSTERVPLST